MKTYRQGDVLLVQIEPRNYFNSADWKKRRRTNNRLVLAEGETTGHAHTLESVAPFNYGVAFRHVISDDPPAMWLELEEPAVLTHQEHGAIDIPPGIYEMRKQRVFDPEAMTQSRWVED